MGLIVRPNGSFASGAKNDIVTLREVVTEVSRAIEDMNWTSVSADPRSEDEAPYDERKRIILRSRRMAKKNPLAVVACELLTSYVLGQGISVKPNNRAIVGRLVDELWDNPVNMATFTAHAAMSEFLVGAYTDGAQALILFPDKDKGTVELGSVDVLYIEDVLSDVENWRVPLWYKVRKPTGRYNYADGSWQDSSGDEFVWYRHWRNDRPLDPTGKTAPKAVEPGLFYHAKHGKGKFGKPGLEAGLDFLREHKYFMEDRATINRAAASIAFKKKQKGGVGVIAAEVTRLQSTLINAARGYEYNPPPTTASTHLENDQSDLTWMAKDTGGQGALADEKILRMMSGAGMGGIPNHLFGDDASANLASATAMNAPLNKRFEQWQQWVRQVCIDLVTIQLETAHEAGRCGPRDDASRYADKVTVGQQVLGAAPSAQLGAGPNVPQLGPGATPAATGAPAGPGAMGEARYRALVDASVAAVQGRFREASAYLVAAREQALRGD